MGVSATQCCAGPAPSQRLGLRKLSLTAINKCKSLSQQVQTLKPEPFTPSQFVMPLSSVHLESNHSQWPQRAKAGAVRSSPDPPVQVTVAQLAQGVHQGNFKPLFSLRPAVSSVPATYQGRGQNGQMVPQAGKPGP